jgi:hypothetical protein
MRLIAGLSFVVALTGSTLAEDPHGHAKYHHGFYEHLKVPGSGLSCCNDNDCAPAAHRSTPAGIEVYVRGRWIVPPRDRTMEMITPDGGAHVCASTHNIYCVVIPRSSS